MNPAGPASASKGALQALGLHKRFGDTHAVRGVSLDVAPGEFVTLLGGSGSGKTTTLRIIAGFIAADEGTVDLDGSRISGATPHERNIGMVFQSYALFPHMTAAENIAFPLALRGVKKVRLQDRVRQTLALVRLDGMGDRYPHQLSGGQQRRVALARAIGFQPRILLMDEPLGALDKKLRDALQIEISRIQRELSVTVVYATRDQEEALAMSDRIAIYRDGHIEQIGAGDELYERPGSVFVADFMGDSNIVRGIFRRAGAHERHLEAGGLTVKVPNECGNGPIADMDRAAVVVRPERLHLIRSDGDSVGGRANSLRGTVRKRIYLGAFSKYEVQLHGGPSVTARVAADADTPPLPIGGDVRVDWAVEHSVLLRDEPVPEPDANEHAPAPAAAVSRVGAPQTSN
jgi:putative spermidine/putrescine transport system ATP-binding protein